MDRYILKIACSDDKGLIYKISKILYENGTNIEKNDEFVENSVQRFFYRAEIVDVKNSQKIYDELKAALPNDADIYLHKNTKKDIIILATKESHALGDILLKHDSGELNANILCVVSNYDTLKPLVDRFDIPFHSVSHEGLSREEHEKAVLEVMQRYDSDYVVLAKYMRILTSDFVKHYQDKIVNIHHSFLPAFIGANPYKQAYERGVKIIGATAHVVNDDLDEGPIIYQDVIRVDHSYSWREMQKAGKDVERVVLTKALDLLFDDKIFVYNNKTIIF
jgi:formyltetrahydrofolate deformylase